MTRTIKAIPRNSFVAMFDFLGFKELRKKHGTAGLYLIYIQNLLGHIQHSAALRGKIVNKDGKKTLVPDYGLHSVLFKIVSDSVLLFSKGDSLDEFMKIVKVSYDLLCGSIAFYYAPMRGAIGYGDLIIDKNSIWIGSSIEDAYIAEGHQVWAGCSFTSSCEEYILKNGYIDIYNRIFARQPLIGPRSSEHETKTVGVPIVKYDIPEQNNPRSGPAEYLVRKGYALDWTLSVYHGASEKIFADTNESHVQRIIQNTRDFEKWARNENRLLMPDHVE